MLEKVSEEVSLKKVYVNDGEWFVLGPQKKSFSATSYVKSFPGSFDALVYMFAKKDGTRNYSGVLALTSGSLSVQIPEGFSEGDFVFIAPIMSKDKEAMLEVISSYEGYNIVQQQ